jgi:hypothetical protein
MARGGMVNPCARVNFFKMRRFSDFHASREAMGGGAVRPGGRELARREDTSGFEVRWLDRASPKLLLYLRLL